jgi:L-ascorbate metabolism protein UlaG (beta-lactamase superfamily)
MSGARITWLGHATVVVEIEGVRVLTDPVLRNRVGPLRRIAAPLRREEPGRVDAVLLSHLHADHADLPTLGRVARRVPLLAPRGAGDWLQRQGFPDVRELGPGDETTIGGLSVRAVPAIHDGRRRPLGGPLAEAIGYLIGERVYFAGDTDLFAEMAELRETVGAALLPIWGWGSRLGPGHLDPERAARAAAIIEPHVAIPIHYGTLALGLRRPQDPQAPARRFAELMRRHAPSVEVRVLAPGDSTEITRIR